ncbi:hypothetical protein ALC57_03271 [Trachymyrmex cornetzi]|uniref:Double jelly roll-like domain-containing protein n=1 Tax=Trachymyrmex cornetzi TaxID=471704 RepID=A0A151JM33_9HYME|nr:hypothetical protein ALC57_03271 [Trachymyrmex cornetzi]
MVDILNITDEPIFDDRIVKIETHTYDPYANTTFGHSDEIRIPIQQQDLYTLPCDSFLYVEGRLTVKKKNHQMSSTLGNNCVAFMFDEIRYELNGMEIDRNRNVGITSTIKNYVPMTYDKALIALNAGWNSRSDMGEAYFNFCVPLNMLLCFCEDYKCVVVNARHELILIRARNDYNCLVGNPATEPEVELFKVQWRIPHVSLNGINLNSDFYPYDDLNLDFGKKKRYAVLFDMYARFRKAYYRIDSFETLLNVLLVTMGLVNGTIGNVVAVNRCVDGNRIDSTKIVISANKEIIITKVDIVLFEVFHKMMMDLRTSVFSDGQAYVGLSRVSTLEDLHLINFNPASVKANSGAIVEYNRLRSVSKAQLPQVNSSEKKAVKIHDCRWAIPNIIDDVQNYGFVESESIVTRKIYGLCNNDHVSYYANVTLQCAFYCVHIRQQILKNKFLKIYVSENTLYVCSL